LISADKIDAIDGSSPPAELRAVLMPAIPVAVEAAVAAIRKRGPYADLSEDALDRNLRTGLTDAVERWFDTPAAGERGDLHFALGRAHARAGRSLDELMGFYRVAALTMWRRLADIGAAGGVEPKQLYRLAETGFGCVDELRRPDSPTSNRIDPARLTRAGRSSSNSCSGARSQRWTRCKRPRGPSASSSRQRSRSSSDPPTSTTCSPAPCAIPSCSVRARASSWA
jgi:hypothetical protein